MQQDRECLRERCERNKGTDGEGIAYTRIHAIKATVHKSIAYICNPDKTEEGLLVSSFSCTPRTAAYDFKMALSKTSSADKDLAYHLIQSFAPGEVSHEEAHRIGNELAERLLGGDYSYVVTTHTDRKHPHNHIIFCAAGNTSRKKFNSCKKSYYQIRKLSDELCREHGLSVISPSGERGKTYNEWQASQKGNSIRERLRQDIDSAIKASSGYEDFLRFMRGLGYEIKGDYPGQNALKYISFKAPGQKRFIRGSLRSLGVGYSREEIKQRLEEKEQKKAQPNTPDITKAKARSVDIRKRTSLRKKLIDLSDEKYRNSVPLSRWANLQNLKLAASAYANAGSVSELEDRLTALETQTKSIHDEVLTLDKNVKSAQEAHYYLTQYHENLPFHRKYKKSKDPERYLRNHETQLILFDGARHWLKQKGMDTDAATRNALSEEISKMEANRAILKEQHRTHVKEIETLRQELETIKTYLGIQPEHEREKQAAYEHEK